MFFAPYLFKLNIATTALCSILSAGFALFYSEDVVSAGLNRASLLGHPNGVERVRVTHIDVDHAAKKEHINTIQKQKKPTIQNESDQLVEQQSILEALPKYYQNWQLGFAEADGRKVCELRSDWIDSFDGVGNTRLAYFIQDSRLIVSTQSSIDPYAPNTGLVLESGKRLRFDYVHEDTNVVFDLSFDMIKAIFFDESDVEIELAYWPMEVNSQVVSTYLDTSIPELAVQEFDICEKALASRS